MIRTRVSVLSCISAIALAASATAQVPSSGPQVNRAPPAQAVKPPTAQVGNATVSNPGADWVQQQQRARQTIAIMRCRGPLALEIRTTYPNDGSRGSELTLSFNEAASITTIQPGECWRDGGFTFGANSLNRGMKKGSILHQTKLDKCPLFTSMKFEGGKLATYALNETIVSDTMLKSAMIAGPFEFDTLWLDFNSSTGLPGAGRYVVAEPGTTIAAMGCRG
jgi:hypothetical protein